jgi:hypothetical protein
MTENGEVTDYSSHHNSQTELLNELKTFTKAQNNEAERQHPEFGDEEMNGSGCGA